MEDDWLTVLEITGEDRETFLQGQLTQDLHSLTAERPVRFAASCDAKGRVLAVLTLVRHGPRWFAVMRGDQADAWLAHVLRYRLRARVDITRSNSHRVVATATAPAWGPLDADPRPDNGAPITAWRLGDIGESIVAADAVPGDALDMAAWRVARLDAGIADIGAATAGEFTPHMLNLDRIGAISFSKGCYTGQEIVARTQHLGKVKRRARRVRTDSGELPEGALIEGQAGVQGRVAVSAGSEALAVLPDSAGEAPLHLDDGRTVHIDPTR